MLVCRLRNVSQRDPEEREAASLEPEQEKGDSEQEEEQQSFCSAGPSFAAEPRFDRTDRWSRQRNGQGRGKAEGTKAPEHELLRSRPVHPGEGS